MSYQVPEPASSVQLIFCFFAPPEKRKKLSDKKVISTKVSEEVVMKSVKAVSFSSGREFQEANFKKASKQRQGHCGSFKSL